MGPRTTPLGSVEVRRTLGLFATGVTVVGVVDPETGTTRGMTANAFMPASLRPPLIVVSVRAEARLRATLGGASSFGVSILPQSLEREARRFAGLAVADHEPDAEFIDHAGVPILAGALAWFVLSTVDRYEIGDHTMFVGEIIDLGSSDEDAPALAYHRSDFAHVMPAQDGPPLPIDAWGGAVDLWG
jgi:flavin reductase (DIM6/NTAB) family NADH-FMN oxidoreductase RutF